MDKFMYESERMLMLKKVFEHLQDKESKEIYTARSLFSLTDDNAYMADAIKNMAMSQCLIKEIAKNRCKKLILFGAGTWGKAIINFFKDIEWDYVVDNNKAGQIVSGYPVTSFDNVMDLGGGTAMLC